MNSKLNKIYSTKKIESNYFIWRYYALYWRCEENRKSKGEIKSAVRNNDKNLLLKLFAEKSKHTFFEITTFERIEGKSETHPGSDKQHIFTNFTTS